MTNFENFHHQFRGLVERAMLSELEDMLRMIAEALRRLDGDSAAHAERAAEALHAARRRGAAHHAALGRIEGEDLYIDHSAPRNRIDVPRAACPVCGLVDAHVMGMRCSGYRDVTADEGGEVRDWLGPGAASTR